MFDPAGDLVFKIDPDSDLDSTTRRVNRVKTLDGGVSINDTGFSDGDREFKLKAKLEGAEFEQLKRLYQLYPLLSISTKLGVFEGVIDQVSEAPPFININFLVKVRLNG